MVFLLCFITRLLFSRWCSCSVYCLHRYNSSPWEGLGEDCPVIRLWFSWAWKCCIWCRMRVWWARWQALSFCRYSWVVMMPLSNCTSAAWAMEWRRAMASWAMEWRRATASWAWLMSFCSFLICWDCWVCSSWVLRRKAWRSAVRLWLLRCKMCFLADRLYRGLGFHCKRSPVI